jgi:hypothetical protein
MTPFTIRDAQMAVFSEAMLRQFAVENASRLKVRLTEAVAAMTEDAVVERVLRTAQRARAHGVTRKRDIEQFIDCEFLYGPEFENRHSEPGRILARSGIDGARKMALIQNWELFDRPERSGASARDRRD